MSALRRAWSALILMTLSVLSNFVTGLSSVLGRFRGRMVRMEALSGAAACARLLRDRADPPPLTGRGAFHSWLREHVGRQMEHDSQFRARVRVREIERAHAGVLRPLRGVRREARAAYEASATRGALEEKQRSVSSLEAAVAHMSGALSPLPAGSSEKDVAKRSKRLALLPAKREALAVAQAELGQLEAGNAAWAALQEAKQALAAAEEGVGLSDALSLSKAVGRQSGQQRSSRGRSFESSAEGAIRELLVPRVAAREGLDEGEILVERGLTLGMGGPGGSTGEMDYCLCVRDDPGSPSVRALLVVEIKKNAEDIGVAFAKYQRTLAWLARDAEHYDAKEWKCRAHPDGVFRGAEHGALRFGEDSFAGLWSRRDRESGLLTDGLAFVTRPAKRLVDMSSKAIATVESRVSRDLSFDDDLSDLDAVAALLDDVAAAERTAAPLATSEVLRRYAAGAAGNVVCVP